MASEMVREQILQVAYGLFYTRGIQSVGMDELCKAAQVSRKTFYSHFPSKDALLLEVIGRWHTVFMAGVTGLADAAATPREAMLSIFDFLAGWFDTDSFRGCGFMNTFGEMGSISPAVASIAREHKLSFQVHLIELVRAAGGPDWLGPQLAILVEGAITTAAISGSAEPARQARLAAETLTDAAMTMAMTS
jgi:AcrR family transcriptional regulator